MDDNKIIDLFFARDQRAITELSGKYGRLCHSLAMDVLGNHTDAEECVNDAYLGVWNAVPPTRPNPLRAYVCKIVRNLSLKRYHSNTAQKRNSNYDVALSELDEVLATPDTVEAGMQSKDLVQVLEAFLDSLEKDNRAIFMQRYWFSRPYADIAKSVGISEKNVSVRLTRMRAQLRKFLVESEIPL